MVCVRNLQARTNNSLNNFLHTAVPGFTRDAGSTFEVAVKATGNKSLYLCVEPVFKVMLANAHALVLLVKSMFTYTPARPGTEIVFSG